MRDVEIADDHGQQIVEVMRHAAGELADGFHLLRLGELLARLAQLHAGVAKDLFGAPALRAVDREDEARRRDADHEDDDEGQRPLLRAPGQRTAAEENGFPGREGEENECRAGGIARAAAQRRPERRQHGKNGQRRRGPHVGSQRAEGERSQRARRREDRGRFQKRGRSNDRG